MLARTDRATLKFGVVRRRIEPLMQPLANVLLLVPLALTSAASQETKPQEEIEELIQKWKSDDLEVRDSATKQILARWKEWTEQDLRKLSLAKEGRDSEVSHRAREAQGRIQIRKRLGEALVNLGECLLNWPQGFDGPLNRGGNEDRLKVLDVVGTYWRIGDLDDEDLGKLVGLAMEQEWNFNKDDLLNAVYRVKPYAPLVIGLLKDAKTRIRRDAAVALGHMEAREHVAELVSLLTDKKGLVRSGAAEALGIMRARQHAHQLLPLLKDNSTLVRREAVWALGRMMAKEHSEAILPLLEDRRASVRRKTVSVLWLLGAKNHTAKIVPLLEDRDRETRYRAVEALGLLGAVEYAEKILPLLEDQNQIVRESAIYALGQMGAQDQTRVLLTLLKDEDEDKAGAAAAALGALVARAHAGEVAALLKSRNKSMRVTATVALGRMGAKETSKQLEALLEDEESSVRVAAIEALARIGAEQAAGKIRYLLDDKVLQVQTAAAYALGELFSDHISGEEKMAAIEKLVTKEQTRSYTVSEMNAVSTSLVRLGRKELPAQKDLLELVVRNAEPPAQRALAEALAQVHETEAWRKLTIEVKLVYPIGSVEDLKNMIQKVGLELGEPEEIILRGRLGKEIHMTVRGVLERLLPGMVLILEGDTVRLMEPTDALSYWKKRLAKN